MVILNPLFFFLLESMKADISFLFSVKLFWSLNYYLQLFLNLFLVQKRISIMRNLFWVLEWRTFDITVKLELSDMASLFFNRAGVILYYVSICIYLYDSAAVYGAIIGKKKRKFV